MIFYCKADGTVTVPLADAIYQGSVDVNDIILIAPYKSSAAVSVIFTLPNGRIIAPRLSEAEGSGENYDYNMSSLSSQPGFEFYSKDGVPLNVWRLSVDFPLTELPGALGIQFLITWVENGKAKHKTTSNSTVTIGKGGNYKIPDETTENALYDISAYVAKALESAAISEGYAVGTVNGETDKNSEYYENNAKYYANKAKLWSEYAFADANKSETKRVECEHYAEEALKEKNEASAARWIAISAKEAAISEANRANSDATSANTYKEEAAKSANLAKESEEGARFYASNLQSAYHHIKYWDTIIDNITEENSLNEQLSNAKGNVLVKGISLSGVISLPNLDQDNGYIEFRNCTIVGDTKVDCQRANYPIRGLTTTEDFKLHIFGGTWVEHCGGPSAVIELCASVIHCDFSQVIDCAMVTNCWAMSPYSNYVTNCQSVSDIFVGDTSGPIAYQNNVLIDPYTCAGFITEQADGMIPIPKKDGTMNFIDPSAFGVMLNMKNSSSTGGLQQLQDQEDGVPEGYFKFTGKNDRAVEFDPDFFNNPEYVIRDGNNIYVKYGAIGAYAASLCGKGAAPGKRALNIGTTNIARGKYSFAHGDNCVTSAPDSRAGGYMCATAPAAFASSADGCGNIATRAYERVAGTYSDYEVENPFYTIDWRTPGMPIVPDESEPIDMIGNGSSDTNRHNAITVFKSGNMLVNGNLAFQYHASDGKIYKISLVRILEELIDRGFVTVGKGVKTTDVNL